MPKMSDTMEQGLVVRWLKKVGDLVESGDLLAEIETDKATMELEAYESGTLLHIGLPENAVAKVNEMIAILGDPGEEISHLLPTSGHPPSQPDSPPETVQAVSAPDPSPLEEVHGDALESQTRLAASPLAKKLAQEKGIDLKQIVGSGPKGRTIRADLINISDGVAIAEKPAYTSQTPSPMRQRIAQLLTSTKQQVPHFYTQISVEMDPLLTLRDSVNPLASSKTSINDWVIKAVALALKDEPAMNTAWMDGQIYQYHRINVGVAIALPAGLVVPVVRQADEKGILAISQEMKTLRGLAESGRLSAQSREGATFTISNLGMLGVSSFSAIINPPAAAILAVGAVQEKPVVREGKIVVGSVMELTLSCDHRVLDGAQAALFLSALKKYIETPLQLLL